MPRFSPSAKLLHICESIEGSRARGGPCGLLGYLAI